MDGGVAWGSMTPAPGLVSRDSSFSSGGRQEGVEFVGARRFRLSVSVGVGRCYALAARAPTQPLRPRSRGTSWGSRARASLCQRERVSGDRSTLLIAFRGAAALAARTRNDRAARGRSPLSSLEFFWRGVFGVVVRWCTSTEVEGGRARL